MQTDITPLLQGLADKLGTTIEHLWSVLIRQAYISAVLDLIQYAIIAYALHRLIRFTKAYFSEGVEAGERRKPMEGTGALLVGAWVFVGLLVFVAFFSFPGTISALLNPEFWALEKVLSNVGT